MDITRVQLYLLDLESLLEMRDQHLRTLRGIQMEENLLGGDFFGNTFQEDRKRLLEQLKESRKEADDAIRAIDSILAVLSENPREKVVELKVALNRVVEARAVLAEVEQAAELEPESISPERIGLTKDYYNRVLQQAHNLVPKDYNPAANIFAAQP